MRNREPPKPQKKKRGICMEYKRLIIAMITEIKEDDVIFLRQIYALIRRHMEKVGIDSDSQKAVD